MWWLVVGAVLLLLGVAMTLRAVTSARTAPAGAASGLAVALSASVAFWGLVALVVGLVVVGR